MPFYIFAWLASFVYGLETILIKVLSKHSVKNPWLLNYIWSASSVVFLIPLAFIYKAGFPANWSLIVYSAFINALFSITYMFALAKIDVSVFSPLFNFKTVFSVILGFIFLKEVLTPIQILFIAVLFLAGFFVSMDERLSIKSFFNKAVFILLSSAFLYAIFSVLINKAVAVNGYWTSNLWVSILNLIFLTFTVPLFKKDIKTLKVSFALPLVIVVLSEMIGNLAAIKAYSENVGLSSAIISIPFSMLMAMGLAFILPKLLEKHNVKVYAIRILSAGIMLYAALQLSR